MIFICKLSCKNLLYFQQHVQTVYLGFYIVFILNHEGTFLEDIFILVDFWSFLLCLKPCCWIFIKKNVLETHIFKCLTVQNNFSDKTNKYLIQILEMIKKKSLFMYIEKKGSVGLTVFEGGPLNTLKLFLIKCFIFFITVHKKCIFYFFKTFFLHY